MLYSKNLFWKFQKNWEFMRIYENDKKIASDDGIEVN